jgi:hypothetical protein
MARNEIRVDLIAKYGSEEKAREAIDSYVRDHSLTAEQMMNGEWVTLGQLGEVCHKAGITTHGPDSILIRATGRDRGLENPWHPSLRVYWGKGKRWFHKSSLTDGVTAILNQLEKGVDE